MKHSDLPEKIGEYAVQVAQEQMVVARLEEQAAILAMAPAGTALSRSDGGIVRKNGSRGGSIGKQVIDQNLDAARRQLARTSSVLAGLEKELHRREMVARKPVVLAKLNKAKTLVERHNAIAKKCQQALVDLHSGLIALDASNNEIYNVTKDTSQRGAAALTHEFHVINRSQRLRFPLAASLNKTVYSRLYPLPMLKDLRTHDLAEAESHVGFSLIRQLEQELAALSALEQHEPEPFSIAEEESQEALFQ